jgi:hypothetical protein
MTVKDDHHHLVDELDEDAAREALAYMQTLGLPHSCEMHARDRAGVCQQTE